MANTTVDPPQNAWPRIVQGSRAPVFKGLGARDFICPACGQILVQGYDPHSVIALDLQCAACKTVTRTDSWPVGEPLPHKLVTLGETGHFLIAGTVDLTGGGAITCDQEIARVAMTTGARPPPVDRLDLTPDGLGALRTRLELLTEGAFEPAVASTARAIQAGNRLFMKYPPAWAFLHLQAKLSRGVVNVNGEDGAAIIYLQMLLHLVARWQHHPRFSVMSKGLIHEFHHTLAMLTAASYLSDHGNSIGITDPGKASGRSPDLFVRLGASERIAIEVKAPSELQWPSACPSPERLDRIIEKQLKSARDQIDSGAGGIVVLGASGISQGFREAIEASVSSLGKRGKISSRMAAVSGVVLVLRPELVLAPTGGVKSDIAAHVFIQPNQRFAGPTFLKT